MTRAGGDELGQGELGEAEKRDLESGLAAMSSKNQGEGIECVPVWLDDTVHYSESRMGLEELMEGSMTY